MDKLKMHSPDLTKRNIDKIAELFPTVVTEAPGDDGEPVRGIDFDLLRQELSDHVVEGPQERYHLDWPGKREALFAANAPIAKTLRPVREESVDFDATQNLFIEGDNLDALKLLRSHTSGRSSSSTSIRHTTPATTSSTTTTMPRRSVITWKGQVKLMTKALGSSPILKQTDDFTPTG